MFRAAAAVLLLALFAAPAAHAVTLKRTSVGIDAQGQAFDYSHHGQDWVQGVCSSRERQSPVNFADLSAPVSGKLSYSYLPVQSSFEVNNNGHTLSADLMGLGYGGITYENSWYNLLNVNFHAESEHTFIGSHLPMEMHLVHKKYDSDALLVVAVPFQLIGAGVVGGPAPAPAVAPTFTQLNANASVSVAAEQTQPAAAAPAGAPGAAPAMAVPYVIPTPGAGLASVNLQKFLSMAPPIVNQKATAVIDEQAPLDMNAFLEGGQYFEYAGSLTAPPCAEVVTWFVRRNPVEASTSQLAVIRNAIMSLSADYGNWRSVMPLNGRPVAVRQGVKEEPPPQAPASIAQGKNPKTDREYRAIKMSRDALKVATAATDYVRQLDGRLREASAAHAQALQAALPVAAAPAPAAGPMLDPASVMIPPSPGMSQVAADAAKAISSAAETAIKKATTEISKSAEAATKNAGGVSIATPVAR